MLAYLKTKSECLPPTSVRRCTMTSSQFLTWPPSPLSHNIGCPTSCCSTSMSATGSCSSTTRPSSRWCKPLACPSQTKSYAIFGIDDLKENILSKIWSVNIFLKISNGYLIHLSETNSVTLKPRSQINYEHKKQQIIGVGNLDIPEYQDSWGYSNISGRVRVPVWHCRSLPPPPQSYP